MIAGMVLTNLLYVVVAVAVAVVVSAFVMLRHRRPKSLEAGIEMFSRELKALEPERRMSGPSDPGRPGPRPPAGHPGVAGPGGTVRRDPSAGGGPEPRLRSVTLSAASPTGEGPFLGVESGGVDGAGAPSPDGETESG